MTSYATGHHAEKIAAQHLVSLGFRIIELNWRTKWCEIDIIAQKDTVMHFVEVKFRQNSYHGDGLDYITSKKLQQMTRAAESWVTLRGYDGEYTLSAISMTGPNYTVQEFLLSV